MSASIKFDKVSLNDLLILMYVLCVDLDVTI